MLDWLVPGRYPSTGGDARATTGKISVRPDLTRERCVRRTGIASRLQAGQKLVVAISLFLSEDSREIGGGRNADANWDWVSGVISRIALSGVGG
jgi:hypothetical protein